MKDHKICKKVICLLKNELCEEAKKNNGIYEKVIHLFNNGFCEEDDEKS